MIFSETVIILLKYYTSQSVDKCMCECKVYAHMRMTMYVKGENMYVRVKMYARERRVSHIMLTHVLYHPSLNRSLPAHRYKVKID